MSERLRTTAISFIWTLAACHRAEGPATVDPPATPPIAEAEPGEALLEIIPVAQVAAFEVQDWKFEPGGARLASTEHGDCSVWDVDTGRLIRALEGDASPCRDWAPAVDFESFHGGSASADGRLEYDTSKGVAILDAASGQTLRELACSDCDELDEIVWSREGHQLALAWTEPPRLEVWDADTGARVNSEVIPVEGELEELELGWTEGGATVTWLELGPVTECEEFEYNDCDWDEALQIATHRPLSREILVLGEAGVELSFVHGEIPSSELRFDPEGHWAIWGRVYSVRRQGLYTDFHVEGLVGEESGLTQVHSDEGYSDNGVLEREGRWRSDGTTQWAVEVGYSAYGGYPVSLDWEVLMVSPAAGQHRGSIIEELGYNSYSEVDLLGFVGDAPRVRGEYCVEDTDDSCTRIGPKPPPGCELLDAASGHGGELLDCAGIAFLRSAGTSLSLSVDAGEMTWWWSRGGALAVYDGDNFEIADVVAGVVGKARTDVIDVIDTKLGAELNRLIVLTAAGTELLDASSGAVLLHLDKVTPEQAALSPSGDRLALLDEGQFRIVEVASGETLAKGAAAGDEIAFRQDGEAVYIGAGQPEYAFDAGSGEPLLDAKLDPLLDVLDRGGRLDPSWRWIMDDEASVLVRTLDARALTLTWDGCWLPDTGHYAGSPPGSEVAFRIGSDPWALPEFDAKALAEWLKRPDLFEAFVTGAAIPARGLRAAELERLRATSEPESPK